MVSVTCTKKDCANADILFNVLGDHKTVECGGCGSQLKATDKRPDPVVEELTLNAITD
jgi:ribosomal protein S27E